MFVFFRKQKNPSGILIKKKMEPDNLYKEIQAEIKAIDKMLKKSQEIVWNHSKNNNEDLMQVMQEARVETNKNRLSMATHLGTVERCIRNNQNNTREYLHTIKGKHRASNSFVAQIKLHHKNIEHNLQTVMKHIEKFKK